MEVKIAKFLELVFCFIFLFIKWVTSVSNAIQISLVGLERCFVKVSTKMEGTNSTFPI